MSDETNAIANDAEAQLINVLKSSAAEFVKGSGADGIALGEQAVQSIFAQEIAVAALPTLDENASLDTRAALEEILTSRTSALQLAAAAERADAERLERVRSQAQAIAGKLAAAGGTILAGAAVKALLSSK